MKLRIEPGRNMEEDLLLLERAARELFREAKVLTVSGERIYSWDTTVTQGLPRMTYRVLYRPDQAEALTLVLSNGDRADVDREDPGTLNLSGSERFCGRLQEFAAAFVPDREEEYPLMDTVPEPKDAGEISRILYGAAERLGAQVFLSGEESGGRLLRVSGRWLLDTVDEPLDMLIRKNGDWAVYHFPRGQALESSLWFFETEGILERIANTEGGMTNG